MWAALTGAQVQSGYGPHYARGVMERVSANRDMPMVECMVSSPVYEVGAWVWVYGTRTGVLLHCRVTDVSHPRDVERHKRTGRIAELGWQNTKALCGATNERVVDCPILVVRL